MNMQEHQKESDKRAEEDRRIYQEERKEQEERDLELNETLTAVFKMLTEMKKNNAYSTPEKRENRRRTQKKD